MTNFYCFTCDRPRDSNDEDMADYSGDEPICGDCVQAAEEQNNGWAIQNQDDEQTNNQLGQ